MRRIKPDQLTGPRAYFTAFDPRIVERAADQEQLKKKPREDSNCSFC